MKALFLSGGAAKFIAIVSACIQLVYKKKYKPDLIVGASSGAITAIMMAVNKLHIAKDIGMKITLKTIFNKLPFDKDGGMTIGSTWKFIKGFFMDCNSLGEAKNLEKLLRTHVSEGEFYTYQDLKNSPDILILTVNASTFERKYWDLKLVNYDTAIKAVLASSAIAGIMPAINIQGEYYYDGGYRDHCPGSNILQNTDWRNLIGEFVSVYSRPETYPVESTSHWRKNVVMALLSFAMPVANEEISAGDQYTENKEKAALKIKGCQIFIDTFLKWPFDTNKHRLKAGYYNGIRAVDKYFDLN